ncbi:MAG: hypothetical protein C0467_26445 [Planctomycetaceae bacterium]|nr:hypothetical protein [Planctomycetaceae bacterium]
MNERELFEGALEHPDSAQRRAYLDRACGDDATLRERVEALLASHDAASQFLNVPAPEQLRPTPNTGPTQTLDLTGTADTGSTEEDAAPDLNFLSPPLKPGSLGTLGHYEVQKLLGQGGFGLVFRAFDERLHRHVAIKVLNPQLAATSPPRKRFLREARSAAAVKHENVVQVYAVEERPLPYLVMEYVDGPTLKDKMDGTGPLELPEVLHLGRQMAAGLAAAHEKGLIHRDIKPGNILIESGAEPRVKITDFGLARAADDASLTRSGVISGTPMYMAPEQAQGLPLDHRADLFSLGSVLYQMVSGRPPFRAATTVAVLKRVADETPRPIQEILPTVSNGLCAAIAKLHAKRPEDRFQSAREVADLFAHWEASLRQYGRVELPPDLVPKSPAVPESPAAAAHEREAPPRRRGRRYAVVGAFLLLVVGALAAALWPERSPNRAGVEPQTGTPVASNVPPAEAIPQTKSTRLVRTAADYDEFATGQWIDLVPGPKEFDALVNANPERSRQGAYAYFDGTVEIKAGQLRFPVLPASDAIFRARVRKTGLPDGDRNLNLKLRASELGNVSACYNGQGHFCLGRMGPRWRPLVTKTYPNFNDDEEFELALATIGNRAWTFANGQRVLAADLDVDLPPGRPDLGLHDRARTETAFFRQVQYQALPLGTLATASKPATLEFQQAYDFAAATAMRKLGSVVRVGLNGQDLRVEPHGPLPKDPFLMRTVYLEGVKQTGRLRPLEPLRWCVHLEDLFLYDSLFFDADLDWLENCPMLKTVHLGATAITGRTLARLKDANELRHLMCWGVQFTNEDLKPLAGKPIEEADFTSWKLTDGCAETMQSWTKLKNLRLAFSSIGDDFLANAAPWPDVEKLGLYNTLIGDRGVVHLQKCPKLADIHLGETAITDEALTHLAKVPSLKKLTITKTNVTAAGVAKFREARPDCVVVWDNKP